MATFPFGGGGGGNELIAHMFFAGAIKNICQCDQRSKEGGWGGGGVGG